jgi:sirohydrochlorin ferrochelatase
MLGAGTPAPQAKSLNFAVPQQHVTIVGRRLVDEALGDLDVHIRSIRTAKVVAEGLGNRLATGRANISDVFRYFERP